MALTPMMQQYFEIKEKHKDCILFFRLGDFYEMFFEDAETASRELELVLTGRDCGMEKRAPMCGIPFHSSEGYVARLVEKGYKVAICEQVEDPSKAKGIVKRDVIKIVTPGTLIDSNLLEDTRNNFIASVYVLEDRFSLSFCDISTGEFLTTSSFNSYFKAIDEMSKFSPAEIILVETKFSLKINLEKLIKSKFNLLINKVDEYSYTEDSLVDFDISNIKEEEKISSGILYSYIKETQKGSLSHVLKVERYDLENYMMLDSTSRKNLELTETIRGKSKKGSLIGALDKTKTPMGGRLLRKWIEEPLVKIDEINLRLEVVEEFIDNLNAAGDFKEFLSGVYDIERITSKISSGAVLPKDMVSLKNSLSLLPDIKESLSMCRSLALTKMHEEFDTLGDIHSLISSSIMDSPSLQIKEGNIIKDGYSIEVDELREAMQKGKQWIMDIESREREETGIKSLKVSYNKVFGYYIEVTKSNLSSVPENRYIRKQTLANCERYITEELKTIEEKVLGAEEKIKVIEYNLYQEIREKVALEIERILKTAKIIATIDVLLSFSEASFENGYVKPIISKDDVIDIKEGRHPVVERVIDGVFVPNCTYLNNASDTISIITGPNMAGKSTYMRQVALITLMAQIGCFVPASSAVIGIVDRIFTRIGASDDLSLGQSTFMVEMAEVSNILTNATRNSLVILDEVGRGTSTYDGLSIAWAVVDYIANSIGCKTLFATHYHELTELEEKIQGVKNYCISVKEHGEDIIFLRKIVPGGADKSYGIQVAKLAGLPDKVIDLSKTILQRLEENDINNKNTQSSKKIEPLKSNKGQLSLFDANSEDKGYEARSIDKENSKDIISKKERDVLKEIENIDIINMTPLDAINYIYKLKEKLKSK
ncbi:DNA mismatch repair protein MutS [Clostridium cylindrosporum DSM 605]|uniref:DNA mismatch repair protein MutS n=2 Tax=Clostridium cylindrosporum TaxID=1495 RepID=A0A0J8DFN0_CLOCY|nr:DNA mismatch repair protein MutS [Clostridium cylindrosporum DSM 605]